VPRNGWRRPLARTVAPARHLARDLRELWQDGWALGRLAPICTRLGIQAIYERSAFMQLGGLKLAHERGLPHLLEVNAPIEERRDHHGFPLYRLGVARERQKLALADQVVCVTGPLRRYLIERGADPARVTVIPNGVRPAAFRIEDAARRALRARLGVGADQVAVGFVGRFGFWRGMVPLVEAAARVALAEPRAHFVLIGGGQMLPRVESEIAARGLGRRVTLTGVLPPAEVPAHVAALDLGILAGSPWYSSPIKLFEYGAAGLGIVAPRVEAVAEVLREGEEGLLVEPEDPVAIADAIGRLVADPGRRRALGERFQARVEREFTWERAAARAEELLRASPRRPAAHPPLETR
jgi:glycosyltransferase involved in cell wall biosynthesis